MDIGMYRLTKTAKFTGLQLIICIIGLTIGFVWEVYYKDKQWDKLIYPGVKVVGIDLGGKTKEESKNMIESQYIEPLFEKGLNLIVEGKKYKIDLSKLILSYNVDEAVDKAFEAGKSMSLLNKYNIIKYGISNRYNINFTYNDEYLNEFIQTVEKDIYKESKDAGIVIKADETIEVIDDIKGYRLDAEKFKEQIKKEIESGITDDIVLEPPLIEINASITADDLNFIDSKISSCNTDLSFSSDARTHNVELAAKAINGTILMDGEIFSFNERVGERTKEKGYKMAPVLEDGNYKPGLGGGICQVSSTLYKAALDAGMEIIERKPHRLPAVYIGLGLDATVSWGNIDLKIKNNLGYPVFIETYLKDKNLYVNLYSNSKLKERTYKINNKVYEKIMPEAEIIEDKNLPEGKVVVTKGSEGYKVKVTREIYQNGKLVDTEIISNDVYRPVNEVIRRGIGSS